MTNLDDLEIIKKFGKDGVVDSIKKFPDQARQAWSEVLELKFPQDFRTAKNIVVCGMGGSALGERVVDAFTEKYIRVPMEVFTQYYVPGYVGRDSLVIISSYSGNTEEALSSANLAIERGAKVFAITTGGRLGQLVREENIKAYIFEPKENPSGQPRFALGYSIFAILGLLAKLDFVTLTQERFDEMIASINNFVQEFGPRKPREENLAKRQAEKLHAKIPIIIASEHLVGVAHVFKNQLNETAKTFSASFDIPELNHHLMEGLSYPKKAKELLHFIFLSSKLYSERVAIRYPITVEVVEKNYVEYSLYSLQAETKMDQVFEVLIFSLFVSFYLAIINGVNPSKIPWVDYFKTKLSEGN